MSVIPSYFPSLATKIGFINLLTFLNLPTLGPKIHETGTCLTFSSFHPEKLWVLNKYKFQKYVDNLVECQKNSW